MTKSVKHHIYHLIFRIGKIVFFFKNRRINEKLTINKILVCSLYFRGDVLFHTPLLRMLRYMYPDACIDVWIKSRSEKILEGNKNINSIIVFDDIRTANYNEETKLSLRKKLKFLVKIRHNKYDLFIDLTGKYSTALMGLFSGPKYSIGINYNGFGFCYNKFVDQNTSLYEGHLVDKYLNVLKIGLNVSEDRWAEMIKETGNELEIFIDEKTKSDVESEFKKKFNLDRPLISIHTTAGWEAKTWGTEKFSILIQELIDNLRYNVVIVGDYSDSERVNKILENIHGVQKNMLFLPMSLKGTAEIIRNSAVFIGADSVPLHLASAVDTPSIGLFGPTNPEFSKPRGEKHIVIYHRLFCSAPYNNQFCTRDAGKSCPTVDCMKLIEVNEVVEKVKYLIDKYYEVRVSKKI